MAASYRRVSTSEIKEYIDNMEHMRKATEGLPHHERVQKQLKENLKAARDELRRR